jgi:hypothetical protein
MILTLVLVGENYTSNPDEAIKQIERFKNRGWDVYVLTDKPELFPNTKTEYYQNKIFSYFDKLLFSLRIAEKTKQNVLYIDHDFGENLTDYFFKNFKETKDYVFFEKWQKWDETNKKYVPWDKFGDYFSVYYLPIYLYFKKINFDYNELTTIRECYMYFPYDDNTTRIIYEMEKIKPIFDYMSVVEQSGFSCYGSSEGIALSYIFNLLGITPKLFNKTLNEPLKFI